MIDTMYSKAIELIDEVNKEDPNFDFFQGQKYPKEFLYSIRMTNCLNDFEPNASLALKIATRAQHIGRWVVPRSSFSMDRVGYHSWRNTLKCYHSEKTSSILQEIGFDEETIGNVSNLLQKKQLKTNPETQTLEDVICLVFLQYYMEGFSEKYAEEKILIIIQKTWKKMSKKGHAKALEIEFPNSIRLIIEKALS